MDAFPPGSVLVPVDFSPRSAAAWRYAKLLAERVGARVEALHVAQRSIPPGRVVKIPPMSAGLRRELEARLGRLLGADAEVSVVEGDVVVEILARAKERGAGLIVMATAGRTGLRHALLGSVTEAVVRLSPVPVLSVRKAPRMPPRRVLAPVSLQPYAMAGFHAAESAAKALDARLTLLNVREASYDAAALVDLMLAANAARKRLRQALDARSVEGRPVERILREASRHDLIVLVAHRRGLLRDGILGTTAEQVLRRSPVPVLTVPATVPARRAAPPGARRALSRPRRSSRRIYAAEASPARRTS